MWSKAVARYFPVQTFWLRGQWRGGEGLQGLLVVGFYSSFPPEPLAKCLIILQTTITSVGKDMENRGPLRTVGGIVNWYSHYGRHYERPSKN